MVVEPAALTPSELVVLLVALGGLVPIVVYRRSLRRWVVLPYGFLLLGAVLTNVEALLWSDLVNLLEHGVANMGAGLATFVVVYLGHRRLGNGQERETAGG